MAERPHILVTGASGFAGGHIARWLAGNGMRVTAVTRQREAAASIVAASGAEVVIADLVGRHDLPSRFDAVVHAAATSIWPGVRIDQMTRDNVEATSRLLDRAQAAGARAFILFSTMSVYGRIEAPVVDERTACVNPDAYGLTKRLCEALVAERAGTMPGLSLRLPAILGRGADRHWLAMAARRMLERQDVPFFHAEAPFNNAVHVDDLARFAAKMIRDGWQGYDTVTLSAGAMMPVRTAVETLRRGLGSASRLIEVAAPHPSFTIDSDRARRLYGYDPMAIGAMLDLYAEETLLAREAAG